MSYEPGQTIFFDPQLYKEDTISYNLCSTYLHTVILQRILMISVHIDRYKDVLLLCSTAPNIQALHPLSDTCCCMNTAKKKKGLVCLHSGPEIGK